MISFATCGAILLATMSAADDWPQLQGNALRSGDAPQVALKTPLGLPSAVTTPDGIYASPVAAGGRVFVVDGSGVVFAINAETLKVDWQFATRGGAANCNNVAAPVAIG